MESTMSVLGCIVAIVLHDSRFKAYECVTPVVAPVPLLCVGHFKLHIHISFKAFIHEMTHEFTKHYSVSDIVLKKQIKPAKIENVIPFLCVLAGIALLLPYCSYLDIVEYMPSTRLTSRCHYYDSEVSKLKTQLHWKVEN